MKRSKALLRAMLVMVTAAVAIIVIVIAIIIAAAGFRPTDPATERDKRIIKKYIVELFKIDYKLYKKYERKPPLPTFPGEEPPLQFVDQRYFKENPNLAKYIDEVSLNETSLEKPLFSLPVGMELRKRDEVLGKVAGVKPVKEKDIIVEDMGDYYRVSVETVAFLDSGKKVKVMFMFHVFLKGDKVKSARFTAVPWMVRIGINYYEQKVRTGE